MATRDARVREAAMRTPTHGLEALRRAGAALEQLGRRAGYRRVRGDEENGARAAAAGGEEPEMEHIDDDGELGDGAGADDENDAPRTFSRTRARYQNFAGLSRASSTSLTATCRGSRLTYATISALLESSGYRAWTTDVGDIGFLV